MKIEQRYKHIKPSELPNPLNIFKKIICRHEFVDDILFNSWDNVGEESHIVYCKKCEYVKERWKLTLKVKENSRFRPTKIR